MTSTTTYASAAAPKVAAIFDADSHLMELPDFLTRNAARGERERLPSLADIRLADVGDKMRTFEGAGGHAPEMVAELMALGERITRGPKWHDALGAFNGKERGLALDLLGFRRQVVFSSFCATKIFTAPDDARYAAADAHNRSMAEFCAGDERLIGVALAPLDDPRQGLATIDEALRLGLGAMWIPSHAPGGCSPGHPRHDAIWRRLEETRTPFLLHVGSASLSIPDEWMNDGRPAQASARGGAEVIGSKDLTAIFHSAQRFISVLLLDGVLEKFPRLKGGVIELGAGWVPDTIRRLDHAVDIWARSEPHLGQFQRKPSEQIRAQLRFTPYAFEDVGAFMRESAPELYLFSSDYPHAEGGRDPIGRFLRSMADANEADRQRFFAGNFNDLYAGQS